MTIWASNIWTLRIRLSNSSLVAMASKSKLFSRERPLHQVFGGGKCKHLSFCNNCLPSAYVIRFFFFFAVNDHVSFLVASTACSCRHCDVERHAAVGCSADGRNVGVVSIRGGGVQFAHSFVPYLHHDNACGLHLVQCCSSNGRVSLNNTIIWLHLLLQISEISLAVPL